MIPVLVERPIYFAVQCIEKDEIGVEPSAINFDVIRRNMERILAVTEVANLQITVGLVNLLGECTARQRRVLAPNACDAATPANGRARLPLPARRLPCEHFCYRWLRVA